MVVITVMYIPFGQSFTQKSLARRLSASLLASVFVKTLRRCGVTDPSEGGGKKGQIAANKAAGTLHV